jgi:hypothetical protein
MTGEIYQLVRPELCRDHRSVVSLWVINSMMIHKESSRKYLKEFVVPLIPNLDLSRIGIRVSRKKLVSCV